MRESRQNTQPNTLWIYNPWLDLIVGCGAWSAPLLLIAYSSLSSDTRIWSVAFYALALLFNYPHYMATIYRAYHRAEDFEKYRIFTVHVTALVLLTLFLLHFWIRLLPWIFTIYLTWSPWHYSGQNYGLFMMFARRAGANPGKAEQRALYGAFVISYLVLFLGFHTGPSADPLFLSLGIPAVVSQWEQIVLIIAFVVLSAFGLWRLARATGWRKLIPSLTLFSSQFLWFLLPSAISLIKGLEIPQSRYSTGILAVMHSAQYLWITSYYARQEASGTDPEKRSWRPFAYFGVLVVGGIALFVPGPWLASRAFHYDFTSSFLIFTALVNIHHFILDGAIWKLRDGRIASLLLNSRDRVADAASNAGGHLATTWRWMVGNSLAPRSLRMGTALLLLAWGSVDQARYYLALRSDNLSDLQRAAALDSFDTPVQMRLARKQIEAGQPQQAEASWKSAIQTNPTDPAPRQALIRLLLDQKRLDEAFTATEAALKYSPNDANLLVDRGLLEVQRGHSVEALANWTQALNADSTQSLPHLYLAHELDREDKALEAASHYEAFLRLLARQRPQDRPAPDLVIGIVLRMADCQARSAQAAVAIKSYQMAERLATQTHQPKLESIAEVNEAQLQARAGKLDAALPLYQGALQLDASMNDNAASALDWQSYGQFLEEAGFAPRLVYACFAKAEALAKSQSGSALESTAGVRRRAAEHVAATEGAAIRRDPEPVLREALILRR